MHPVAEMVVAAKVSKYKCSLKPCKRYVFDIIVPPWVFCVNNWGKHGVKLVASNTLYSLMYKHKDAWEALQKLMHTEQKY